MRRYAFITICLLFAVSVRAGEPTTNRPAWIMELDIKAIRKDVGIGVAAGS